MSKSELLIPDTALGDPERVEMARIWVAKGGLHCNLRIGGWSVASKGAEVTPVLERRAWGILLSDIARHVADALSKKEQVPKEEILNTLVGTFLSEVRTDAGQPQGDFKESQ